MAVHWGEWLDMNALLFTHNSLVVVDSSAVVAVQLILLNSYHDIVGQTDMDEGVHSSSVLFEHLGLLNVPWEVSKNKSISASVSKSEKLESNSILNLLVDVSLVHHILNFQEKWVIEVLRFTCEVRDVLHNLCHRDNWDSHVDTESLNNLILVGVWSGKENNFWVLWPSL